MIGYKSKCRIVYLIDYGLSKLYYDESKKLHISFSDNKNLVGTARYSSINSHLGIEQSRRDDLESLGYTLILFAKGRLPWQGYRTKNKIERYSKIMETKMIYSSEKLCTGLPSKLNS